MTLTTIRPLARSLTPLLDESLPGYILRLAHRLDLTPARVLELTHLARPRTLTVTPARALVTMTPQETAAFADATRLDPGHAAELRLDRFSDRYPPIRIDTARPMRTGPLTQRGWTLISSTRYCPQCLAGDGSEIQLRHGGAWQRRWRLQVVFACATHQRLLNHLCPHCETPALHSKASNHNIGLVPNPRQARLHPAQCRTSSCHGHLDASSRDDRRSAAPEILALQARILHLLDPAGTVQAQDAAQYFELLALVHNLVTLSWPAARPLAGSNAVQQAADTHVQQAQQASAAARAADQIKETNPPMRRLPADPQATAGLLLAADHLLGWPDLAELPDRLAPLIEAASQEPRAWYPLRIHPAWPHEVRRAFLPQVRGFAVPARPSTVAAIPTRQCAYRAHNVPQRLPAQWCDQHLAHLTGLAPKHLRRAAALKLVELTDGHPWSRSAELLHIPRVNAETAVFHTRRWMRDDTNHQAFDQVVELLAQRLDAATPHTDYATRRDALRSWTLPQADWQSLLHELEHQTTHGRGRRHNINNDHLQILTVIIWTHITHSEYLFAPAVLQDKAAHAHAPRTARLAHKAAESLIHSRGGYTTLKAITAAYSNALASHIDQTGTTTGFTWAPPTPMTTIPSPRYTRRRNVKRTATPRFRWRHTQLVSAALRSVRMKDHRSGKGLS